MFSLAAAAHSHATLALIGGVLVASSVVNVIYISVLIRQARARGTFDGGVRGPGFLIPMFNPYRRLTWTTLAPPLQLTVGVVLLVIGLS